MKLYVLSRALVALVIASTLSSCAQDTSETDAIKAAVTAELKDPSVANFGQIELGAIQGTSFACGEVETVDPGTRAYVGGMPFLYYGGKAYAPHELGAAFAVSKCCKALVATAGDVAKLRAHSDWHWCESKDMPVKVASS